MLKLKSKLCSNSNDLFATNDKQKFHTNSMLHSEYDLFKVVSVKNTSVKILLFTRLSPTKLPKNYWRILSSLPQRNLIMLSLFSTDRLNNHS